MITAVNRKQLRRFLLGACWRLQTLRFVCVPARCAWQNTIVGGVPRHHVSVLLHTNASHISWNIEKLTMMEVGGAKGLGFYHWCCWVAAMIDIDPVSAQTQTWHTTWEWKDRASEGITTDESSVEGYHPLQFIRRQYCWWMLAADCCIRLVPSCRSGPTALV